MDPKLTKALTALEWMDIETILLQAAEGAEPDPYRAMRAFKAFTSTPLRAESPK